MRKTLLAATVSALMITVATPSYAVQGASMEQRVKRLERMLENPVLLQLSRRLGEQQRDIQALQDENDRLKRQLANLKTLMDKRYTENDERLSALEGGKPKTAQQIQQSAAQATAAIPEVVTPAPQAPKVEVKQPTETQTAAVAPVQETAQVQTPAQVEAPVEAQQPQQQTAEAPQLEQGAQPVNSEVAEAKPAPIKTHAPTEVEKEKYKKAFSLMRASKYSESIDAFQAFLKNHPKSDLASNAAYWAGEGYLIKEQNQAALDSFMTVVERYPDSSKVPDATLRAGDSYDRLGNREAAIKLYNDIVKQRPHSRAAKNAKKRLEKMK